MIWEPVIAKFKELFGDEGEIGVYFAPGRVNMIGEHTDYNGGHVFPCALTIGTYGVARKRDDKKLRFYSMNFENLGVLESSVRLKARMLFLLAISFARCKTIRASNFQHPIL